VGRRSVPVRDRASAITRVIEVLAVNPKLDDPRREYPELEPEAVCRTLGFAARNRDDCVPPLEAV